LGPFDSPDRVFLKFAEGTQVRLRNGLLTGLADLRQAQRILDRYSIDSARISRLFTRPESELEHDRVLGELSSGYQLADLNLYYILRLPGHVSAAELCDELNAISVVELASPAPLPIPPPSDIPPETPDYTGQQGYLNGPPIGIGALEVSQLLGANGAGVKVVDIEYSWVLDHEDIELSSSANIDADSTLVPLATDPDGNHGTAVLGQLAGVNNAYGVTGIASAATVLVAPVNTVEFGYNLPRAINLAAGVLGPGDVILIEQHMQVCGLTDCNTGCGPVEFYQGNFDAIQAATANGIVVVEAAGNGGVDLDSEGCGGLFDRALRDSGAIIVGAGAPGTRARLPFSSYGERVDLQGWGMGVTTTAYGNLFDPGDVRQRYTGTFSGTSSASPIVAGAVLSIQGALEAGGQQRLEPEEVRALLIDTGTAQADEPEHIGPLPDLPSALRSLGVYCLSDADCEDGNSCTINSCVDDRCEAVFSNDCSAQVFTIYNEATGCSGDLLVDSISLEATAPWINWEPGAPFEVPPGRSQAITVSVDFSLAPSGLSTRRLFVNSNDSDESPYPGGIDIIVNAAPSETCFSLLRTHTGTGSDPAASPGASDGCSPGEYAAGELIQLTAMPASGWDVGSWSGTDNNGATSTSNTVTMPASSHTVGVNYVQLQPDLIILDTDISQTSLSPGESFIFGATTHNQGDGTSEATILRYYLSIDSTISNGDSQISTDAVASLVPGGSEIDTDPETAPATPGTYWVGVCVDVGSGESNTVNNCSSGTQIIVTDIAGDVDKIGVYRPSAQKFILDFDGSNNWTVGVDIVAKYGKDGDVPVAGDWNGDGTDEIGVYRPSKRQFILDIDGNYEWTMGVDVVAKYGELDDVPIIGDWNADGIDDIGVFRPTTQQFILDFDGNRAWTAGVDVVAVYGEIGDQPVVGDWNGDGIDEIGAYCPATQQFTLDSDGSLSLTAGIDIVASYGNDGDLPITGDWNGDGVDDIGVFRPSMQKFILDSDGSLGWTTGVDVVAKYGKEGDLPIIGRW
jgi:hypothetical protein